MPWARFKKRNPSIHHTPMKSSGQSSGLLLFTDIFEFQKVFLSLPSLSPLPHPLSPNLSLTYLLSTYLFIQSVPLLKDIFLEDRDCSWFSSISSVPSKVPGIVSNHWLLNEWNFITQRKKLARLASAKFVPQFMFHLSSLSLGHEVSSVHWPVTFLFSCIFSSPSSLLFKLSVIFDK